MSEVALLRHYPTDWNRARRLQGRTDVPLAADARAALAGLVLPPPWDEARLIASPLVRAVETARALASGRAVATDGRLVELSWGTWEGRTADDLLADARAGFRPTHEWGPDTRAPGGESAREAWARVRPALAEIAAGGAAVIVTHKALMRLILARAADGTSAAAAPEIKRGRLYPLVLRPSGLPRAPGPPVRLVARAASPADEARA